MAEDKCACALAKEILERLDKFEQRYLIGEKHLMDVQVSIIRLLKEGDDKSGREWAI